MGQDLTVPLEQAIAEVVRRDPEFARALNESRRTALADLPALVEMARSVLVTSGRDRNIATARIVIELERLAEAYQEPALGSGVAAIALLELVQREPSTVPGGTDSSPDPSGGGS